MPSHPPDHRDQLLSVIVPVFNERATVGVVIDRLLELPLRLQIIAVDDGSTDGTTEILNQRAAATPVLEVVLSTQNRGKGAAVRLGLKKVKGDFVVIQDADLEYDSAEIPTLIAPLADETADVVYGSRFLTAQKHSTSWLHRSANRILTAASNCTTGLELTDMETCYKSFRADAIDGIVIEQDGFGIEPELTAKLARRGCRFAEVPIRYRGRSYAEGKKVGIADLLNAIYCIGRYGIRD